MAPSASPTMDGQHEYVEEELGHGADGEMGEAEHAGVTEDAYQDEVMDGGYQQEVMEESYSQPPGVWVSTQFITSV